MFINKQIEETLKLNLYCNSTFVSLKRKFFWSSTAWHLSSCWAGTGKSCKYIRHFKGIVPYFSDSQATNNINIPMPLCKLEAKNYHGKFLAMADSSGTDCARASRNWLFIKAWRRCKRWIICIFRRTVQIAVTSLVGAGWMKDSYCACGGPNRRTDDANGICSVGGILKKIKNAIVVRKMKVTWRGRGGGNYSLNWSTILIHSECQWDTGGLYCRSCLKFLRILLEDKFMTKREGAVIYKPWHITGQTDALISDITWFWHQRT